MENKIYTQTLIPKKDLYMPCASNGLFSKCNWTGGPGSSKILTIWFMVHYTVQNRGPAKKLIWTGLNSDSWFTIIPERIYVTANLILILTTLFELRTARSRLSAEVYICLKYAWAYLSMFDSKLPLRAVMSLSHLCLSFTSCSCS